MKPLAPNDNSKNQIYLGGDLSVLNVIPSQKVVTATSSSRKPGESGRKILKARLLWSWLDAEGVAHPAPDVQLILYPQYPEVRLSGFLRGCDIELGQWLDPRRDGRLEGRTLLMGVGPDAQVFAHLVLPGSVIDRQLAEITPLTRYEALSELPFVGRDDTARLLAELRRIHKLGWITGKRLGTDHQLLPCNNQNCGGYTLEAELGISPNGLAEPDFLGWEVKSFTVRDFRKLQSAIITLMTPEPDGGLYKDDGPEAFVRKFGYPDVGGQRDRLNFGGVHTFGNSHPKTGLRIILTGYDSDDQKILDVNGGLALVSRDQCAASWSFRKLINHWKRKHDKAAYLPNTAEVGPPRRYQYADSVQLGRSTQFERFLAAIITGKLYYDPGIKLEGASEQSPKIKRRNQFRIRARDLSSLYDSFERSSL
ncbi:MAG: MvaI/BcnI family restriction endonuclease [Hyphomicrobium sp.]